MAIVSPYDKKRLLIIDDIPELRSSMRSQAATLGINKISVAGNVRDALELIKEHRFDIILCDYYLGGGTDGQQFLEFIHGRMILSRATIFVMITAEKSYESVVTAAECMPDDYLLKPFTAEALGSRLDRLVQKKLRFEKVDRLYDQRRWADLIPACDEIIAARDKYLVDAMRIKGNALLETRRFPEAIAFYEGVLQLRSVPWARLGLAHALEGNGEQERAKGMLRELIGETPRYLAAYDRLGRLHRRSGETAEALAVLDQACAISPNAVTRQRAIAGIAQDAADYTRAEKAIRAVVEKTRHSPLRDVNDYTLLGDALTELGQADRALAVVEEAKASFRDASATTVLAAVEAVAHYKAGRPEQGEQALSRAMQGEGQSLPESAKLALAKACLVGGRQEDAERMLKHVVQNNPGESALHASIVAMMKAHGDPGRAEELIASSNAEVVQLNNDAVRIGRAGDLKAAAAMLREAAERLPGNLQIVANAAYALLLDIHANGMDADKLEDARRFEQMLLEKDRSHPKLADIAAIAARIQRRSGTAS